ncbi:hypothetical protein TNCV_4152651 [Trichonephila clavipes]|nr:hypothetical protein TNCV_4152651 [Trichonephila clavipes]
MLEQIDISRMVDIDILMQIWKNRVKQIDFELKWLSRVGSEVRPTKGDGRRALEGMNLRRALKKTDLDGGGTRLEWKEKRNESNSGGVGELE